MELLIYIYMTCTSKQNMIYIHTYIHIHTFIYIFIYDLFIYICIYIDVYVYVVKPINGYGKTSTLQQTRQ